MSVIPFDFSAIPLFRSLLILFAGLFCAQLSAADEEQTRAALNKKFDKKVAPYIKSFCMDCHGTDLQEAKLDLSLFKSTQDVSDAHGLWEIVLTRLEAGEMPPEDSEPVPSQEETKEIVEWIHALRTFDASQNAGDPGVVLARRLSNAEYNNSIRDITKVDIRPTRSFPVDPANEAGFDNSGESLAMSPALLKKYLEAAREVSEHLVLSPSGLSFAPHPVITDTDRDKYCVKRIVSFYKSQPTDLADYFFACWKFKFQQQAGSSIEDFARQSGLSPKYTKTLWELLSVDEEIGPVATLQKKFHAIPQNAEEKVVRTECQSIRDDITHIRSQLVFKFDNLEIREVHKGAQPFVLWKNEQYATHRRKLNENALFQEGETFPKGTPKELILPNDPEQKERLLAKLREFCSLFPDAFYISERGRDYLDVPKAQQEKGRLLSAGFHSMMGYFRDDSPLYELMLSEQQQRELDSLWEELDFVAFAPKRQYEGFLWFERTDSRYMRDPQFDFARPENKASASEAMIQKLSEVYLEKAKRNGGTDVPLKAIEDYFQNINRQIRWVESERIKSEPAHLRDLLVFANHAWRRKLSDPERADLTQFYQMLRNEEHLSHEDAVRDTMVTILMSPHFLFRMDMASTGEGTRPLTGTELASRLSYFLWSSTPDEKLIEAFTSSVDPHENSKLVSQQVRRMLKDEKVEGLAYEFFANWLDIRRFEEHNSVDRNRYPEFTNELRAAMFEEPIRLFISLIKNDGSLLELLDTRSTFVNPVLAKHYGMDDLKFQGEEWIHLPDATKYGRGGLLPMSVFLTKNSPGLRTSPVKRGNWVVRRLLGERVPPPPPNIPELPEDESQLEDVSLRELLAKHRDNKSCASCHDKIDSIGLAFEGFGPVGEKREQDLNGRTVELDVVYPNGFKGEGVEGLHQYLTQHRQQEFIENFCRKLLTFALGRRLTLSDEGLIVKMQEQLQTNDYRIAPVIETIVISPQFLTKHGGEFLVREP